MGRIHELIKRKDGQIRSAKVLLPANKIIGRPLNLLYPVECPVEETDTGSHEQTNNNKIQNGQNAAAVQTIKPKRQAAYKAMQKLQNS